MATRIYTPTLSFDLDLKEPILLDGNPAHHLISVLRRKIGDNVILFDGKNKEYHTVIEHMDKKRVRLIIKNKLGVNRESPLFIHLVQAISKGDRMDWVVQKAVELGVSRITPITTQHGAVKLDADRMAKKIEHWQNIAISACEQCGRNTVPLIDPICSFGDFLEESNKDSNSDDLTEIRWILHPAPLPKPPPQGGRELAQWDPSTSKIKPAFAKILIGPEGGFSENEVDQACKEKYTALALGPRIFRTETAAVAAISVLQTYYGDWL